MSQERISSMIDHMDVHRRSLEAPFRLLLRWMVLDEYRDRANRKVMDPVPLEKLADKATGLKYQITITVNRI